jgi:hypothetical protein
MLLYKDRLKTFARGLISPKKWVIFAELYKAAPGDTNLLFTPTLRIVAHFIVDQVCSEREGIDQLLILPKVTGI